MLFSSSSHVWCWCPTERVARCLGVLTREVSHLRKTTQELKTPRPRSAPDACSNLLPKAQVGNELMSILLTYQRLSVVFKEGAGAVRALTWFLWLYLCLPRARHAVCPSGTARRAAGKETSPRKTNSNRHFWGREKREGQRICSAANPNINTSESCNKNLRPQKSYS